VFCLFAGVIKTYVVHIFRLHRSGGKNRRPQRRWNFYKRGELRRLSRAHQGSRGDIYPPPWHDSNTGCARQLLGWWGSWLSRKRRTGVPPDCPRLFPARALKKRTPSLWQF